MNAFIEFVFLIFFCYFSENLLNSNEIPLSPEKVIIGCVCKDVSKTVSKTIQNIEMLGSQFSDYAVIIYENNSSDNTAKLLNTWAKENPHVLFVSEQLSSDQLPKVRIERIARARNIVLSLAKDPKFHDFEYFIMADFDFMYSWPIEEIVNTIHSPVEWDCVSANGVGRHDHYYDRYAFRDERFPLGPELLGDGWWSSLRSTPIKLSGEEWRPVYSAFGGLALYKTATITQFSYSGTVTKDTEEYFRQILYSLPDDHPQLKKYKRMIGCTKTQKQSFPIIFQRNSAFQGPTNKIICCEHIPLHASMTLSGYGKLYVNPKMKMHYR